jgi:hypothetical protein
MIKSAFSSPVFVGTTILVVVATVAVAAGIYLIPGVDAQLPPRSSFDLAISQPYENSTVFLHDNVNIKVDTHTSPVPSWVPDKSIVDFGNDKYELWMDGSYVKEIEGEAPALDRGRHPYTVWITWEPSITGVHTFVVRAKNKYWNAVSNVVHVKVVDLASISPGDSYTPLPGESLKTIAVKFGISPILLGAANPGISSFKDPLGTDVLIHIPKVFEPIDTPPQDDIPVGDNGNFTGGATEPPLKPISKVALWVELGLTKAGFIKDGPPAAPTIFRFKDSCNVNLYIKDNSNNELGFYVYRLDPGSTAFKRIATFGPHTGDKFIEYKDMNLFGKFQYYAAAFNAQGESADKFMSVDFSDKSCLDPKMAAYKLDQATFISKVSADKIYCYYSSQAGEWSRVPEDPNAFFYPTSSGFDLTRSFSNFVIFPQSELKLDCWGWQGGSLIYLGAFDGKSDSIKDNVLRIDGDMGTITGTLFDWYYPPDFPGYPAPMDLSSIVKLPAPYDLRQTNLLDVCNDHFSGTSKTGKADCAESIIYKESILIWEWDPICAGGCEAKIDGFKIYDLDPDGKSNLVATIPERWQHVWMPGGDNSGARYYVRAYLGDHQSKRSNIYTVAGLPDAFKVATHDNPSAYSSKDVSTSKYRSAPCGKTFPGADLSSFASPSWPVQMLVGFSHDSFTTGCLETSDHLYRGRIFYDLSAEKGYVSDAALFFQVNSTKVNGVDDTKSSCVLSLNIVTGLSGDEVTSFKPYLGMPKFLTPSYGGASLDVTEAVKEWVASPSTNMGFLLTGQESGFSTADQSCLSAIQMNGLRFHYFLK